MPRKRAVGRLDAGRRGPRRTEGDELGRRLERVEQLGSQHSARRRLAASGCPCERAAEAGQQQPRQQEECREHEPGDGQRDDPGADGDRSCNHGDGDRPDRTEVEVLERVDVGDETAEQVAGPDRRQARRDEWFESREEARPQRRDGAQRGVVRGEPLEVAEHAAADAEEPDAHDRNSELEDRRLLGRTRDQVPARRHEPDAGADRKRPEQHRECETPRVGACEAHDSRQRMPGDPVHETAST